MTRFHAWQVTVVGFFTEASGAAYSAFTAAASADDTFTYAFTTDEAAAAAQGVTVCC